jgi:hypothetical protein
MRQETKAALQAWRKADAKARDYEKLFGSACEQFVDGLNPITSIKFMGEVAQFRAEANNRLKELLLLLTGEV